jgi:hypothetical protein
MMYGSRRWPGTTVIRNHDGRQCVAYAQCVAIFFVTGQPKEDRKIRKRVANRSAAVM